MGQLALRSREIGHTLSCAGFLTATLANEKRSVKARSRRLGLTSCRIPLLLFIRQKTLNVLEQVVLEHSWQDDRLPGSRWSGDGCHPISIVRATRESAQPRLRRHRPNLRGVIDHELVLISMVESLVSGQEEALNHARVPHKRPAWISIVGARVALSGRPYRI